MTVTEIQIGEHFKMIIDGLSLGVVGATLMTVLPPLTALLSFVWIAFRIYELDTVQKWLKKDGNAGRQTNV